MKHPYCDGDGRDPTCLACFGAGVAGDPSRPFCTAHPLCQSWSMMQAWGVTERPAWQRDLIGRVNASVQAHIARGVFRPHPQETP